MNENIDLTKILDGCPMGFKLYSTVFGEVEFDRVDKTETPYLILTRATNFWGRKKQVIFRYTGALDDEFINPHTECLLFPSNTQRDWSKFERFWDKPKIERFSPQTFKPFDKVLVRDSNFKKWRTDFYSFYDAKYYISEYPNVTSGGCYSYVIPYNEDTKHLVGTTDECPEYYKWWEDLL